MNFNGYLIMQINGHLDHEVLKYIYLLYMILYVN